MDVASTSARRRAGLDPGLGRRLGLGLGGSVAVHAVTIGVWALIHDPRGAAPEPTERRVVKAVALTRTPRPEPVIEPEPEPAAEPQAEVPPSEDAAEIPEPSERPAGPPPPPAVCKGCAMMPSSMGVPQPSKEDRGKTIPWGVEGGVPGGVLGGVPGGVVGGVLGGDPSVLSGAPLVPARKAEPLEPLEVVMQQAIYTPDPDPQRLARTRTAMFDRHDGVNRTAFCIDERGKTVGVRTVERFPGDPQIDAICRQAVKAWRFRPFRVAGRPVRVCSVAVFEIEFE